MWTRPRSFLKSESAVAVHGGLLVAVERCENPADEVGRLEPCAPANAVGGYLATKGKGYIYPLEASGALNSRVTQIRVMDPVLTGKYIYPNGYVSYLNKWNQVVDPFTGSAKISRDNPLWHIEMGK
jgi:hypothetical protein